MKRLQTKLSETALVLVIVPVALLGITLLIPVIPFFLIYAYFSDKKFEKDTSRFLKRMNGACFFCYNSRKSSFAFARDVIVPELASYVRVVFVDGNKVDFGSDSKYISRMLYSIKERKGFPYLLKIEDEQVRSLSVNNQFYSIMIGRKPTAPMLQRINLFFDSATQNSAN